MNKQKLVIASILIVAAISMTTLAIPTTESYVYTQSDITKANPDLVMGQGTSSMRTQEISETKETVVLTLSGTVLSVGDIIDWKYVGDKYGSVPITIEIDKNTKAKDANLKLKKGDSFTFYLTGNYEMDQYYIGSYEPQFEIGEEIIVHIGKASQGPNGPDGDNYFVELGQYGKYKVVEDKAYNEKFKNGKSLDKAFNEAN